MIRPVSEVRALPAVQRAYFYLVALVAIHMVVLAVANLLRVGAEIAMSAPSGGFTGLPFVFSEFNRPSDQYREQASLAIALLAVGLPAWFVHFRVAQRAALRSVEERASALRSFYIHLVIFVTALLALGYGERAATLVLQGSIGLTFGQEENWPARAAGAVAMSVTAAAVLALHVWLSNADRRATLISGRAAALRQLAYYTLAVIGLFAAASGAVQAISTIWEYVTPPSLFRPEPVPVGRPAPPTNEDFLRYRLVSLAPTTVGGLLLWLATWLPLQRGLRAATPDGDVERRSSVRKLAIYLIVFVTAIAVLFEATTALAAIGRRLLGDAAIESFTSVYRELGSPIATVVIFGAIWIFHRRVIWAEAAREAEIERAATLRRLYTYLIAAIGMAMLAIGAAGMVGVFGSQLLGMNTHPNSETATYIALFLVGDLAWAFSWWQAQRRLDDDERRSYPRRLYLYLAILGGVLGVLVFGSATLYRLLNATLAGSFPVATWHDIWHFTVDAAVSAAVFGFHLRVVLADRSAQLPTVATHALTVLVRAVDAAAARARLASALEGQTDISVR